MDYVSFCSHRSLTKNALDFCLDPSIGDCVDGLIDLRLADAPGLPQWGATMCVPTNTEAHHVRLEPT